MRKRIIAVLICGTLLGLTGCSSGVSQEDAKLNTDHSGESEAIEKAKEAFSEEKNVSLSETNNDDTKILHINAYIPMEENTHDFSENTGRLSAQIASEDWFDYEYVSVDFWSYWNTVIGKGKVSSIVLKADNGELEIIQEHIYEDENYTDDDSGSDDNYNDEIQEESQPGNSTIVYEDDNVKISFAEISADGVEFWVENLTDLNITIQADSVSVNGISTSDIMMSDDVAPRSTGKVTVGCDDFSTNTDVETVSGKLRIIDFSETWNPYYYEVTFSDVSIN